MSKVMGGGVCWEGEERGVGLEERGVGLEERGITNKDISIPLPPPGTSTSPAAMNLKNSPTPRDETDHPLGDTLTPTPKTEPNLEVPKKESDSGDDSDKTPVAATAKEFPKPNCGSISTTTTTTTNATKA